MEKPNLKVLVGSQFSMKAMAAVLHKGLEYELEFIAPLKLKTLPGGKVPVMEWQGEVTPDSTKIMERLDKEIPENPLFPEEKTLHQEVAAWEDWIDEKINMYPLYFRWVEPTGWKKGIYKEIKKNFPWPLCFFVPSIIRKQVIRTRIGSFANRSVAQVLAEMKRDFASIEERLSQHDFLHGADPYADDFALYGMVLALEGPYLAGRERVLEELDLKFTRAWLKRMIKRYPVKF